MSVAAETRRADWVLEVLTGTVALVRLMTGAGFFTEVSVWLARLTSSASTTGAGALRVRIDLVAGRDELWAEAISRGARSG